jgi:hypothetical protein
MSTMTSYIRLLFITCVAGATGCDQAPSARGPVVSGLSHDAITLGESLYVVGRGFLPPDQGTSTALFRGTYRWTDDDGRVVNEEVIPFRLALLYDGAVEGQGKVGVASVSAGNQLLRWNRFGPFAVPFGGRGNHPGVFEGEVRVENVRVDGQTSLGGATAVRLEVKPSIVLSRLEPVTAFDDDNSFITTPCGAPALRILPGLAYVMEAEAIGLQADTFVWQVSGANGVDGFSTFTHESADGRDVLGDGRRGDVVVFDALPDDLDLGVVTIHVSAFAADGSSVETVLPIDVVRPLQVVYDGNRELAEYYEPEVVNGPIVGGIGTTVTYSESRSESRQQGVSVVYTRSLTTEQGQSSTENWSNAYGVTETVSNSDSNGVAVSEAETSTEAYGESWSSSASTSTSASSSDGSTWGWNVVNGVTQEQYQENVASAGQATTGTVSTEVGANASIPGLAGVSGKVGTEAGVERSVGEQISVGGRSGASQDRGTSGGGSASTTTGYGSTTVDARSKQVGGTFGVSRQSSINQTTTQTEASSESVVYNIGGATSVNERVAQGESEAWGETWVSTSSDTTLLSFTGKIPNGRCAVVYRQTVRHARTAHLVQHDLCGVREAVGEMVFNEWSWSPNIAIGDDCSSSLPPSTQPKAQCFLACE